MSRNFLLWVDLETTGTDARLDPILEVGAILTGSNYPFEEVFEYEAVCDPGTFDWQDRLGDYVRDMHTKNGLLDDIGKPGAISLAQAETDLLALLTARGKPRQFMLAGSGTSHFDRRFIDVQMPRLGGYLHFPNFDVGVVRRLVAAAGRDDLKSAGLTYEGDAYTDKPHRGLADVRDHLAECRAYCEMFRSMPGGGA